MSAPQSGPRSRHGAALDGAHTTRSVPAPPNSDSPRPNLPPTADGGRRLPGPTAETVASADPSRRPTMTRALLTGTDFYDWIALRRVNDGGIAKVGHRWVESGLRVPGYVTDALTALCGTGLVTLAERDEEDEWGMRRATLTDAGTVRYQRLCQQWQERWRRPAVTEAVPTLAWLTDNPQARTMVRSVWNTLTELEQAGHHPGVITALRRVLTHHQPTPAGRCRTCRRWRWRRRRFPCIVWHQVHSALGQSCHDSS